MKIQKLVRFMLAVSLNISARRLRSAREDIEMKRAIIWQVVAVVLMLVGSSAATAMAQGGGLTVRVEENRDVDRKLNCNDPRTNTATMTVAKAGSVTVADRSIATATLIDPNGKNGDGMPIGKGLVESPTIRIHGGENAGGRSTTVTVELSCPKVFNPTEGIGEAKHVWHTVTINVIVVKRLPDKAGHGKAKDGDGKGGANGSDSKGPKPPIRRDVPTYDPRFYQYKGGELVPRSDAPRRDQSEQKPTRVNQNVLGASPAGARMGVTR